MQAMRRKRSEIPAGSQTRPPANTGSHLARGAQARQKAAQAAEARSDHGQPWRFWLKQDATVDPQTVTDMYPEGIPGNEAEIILLDETLDDVVGMYEHNLEIGGKWGNHEACPREWDVCPLCEKGNKSYYVVFFSVLVLRPWVSKDGKKTGDCTKMLLPVKSAQLAKFDELCQASQKKNGKLRGTYFYMRRDLANAQAVNTGEPVVLDGGVMFDFYPEEQLVEEFGSDVVKSPDGKVLAPENDDITPFDYEAIFKKPSAADLRKRFGGSAPVGSREDAQGEWGEPAASAPAQRTATRRRAAAPVAAAEDTASGEGEGNDNLPF